MLHFNLLLNRVGCCILISDEFFPRLRSGYNEEDIILPTAYFYAALAAGIAAVVVFLVLRVKYGGLNGLYSKAIASFLFLLTALSAAAVNPGHEVVCRAHRVRSRARSLRRHMARSEMDI